MRLLVTSTLLLAAALAAPAAAEPPRLVLLVVVDQLRGDVPERFAGRFGPDGFERLLRRGVRFTNAHYRHAATKTASGHATLVTGANPAEHGVISNGWWDAARKRGVYCVADERHDLVGAETPADRDDLGTSPRNLLGSTIGDELVLHSGGASRAFGVSVKDRGAILPAGARGTAYWYASGAGRFVTSTYYRDALPAWLEEWNAADPARAWSDAIWEPLAPLSRYAARYDDDRPFEVGYRHLDRTFPHPLAAGDPAATRKAIRYTPMGDELLLALVRRLVREERIGRGPGTDFLSVSFSATDYVGHAWGPLSLEAEDNVLRLDRTLAALFGLVDDAVGLDRTVVVLSSDHGVEPCPEVHGDRPAGRLVTGDFAAALGAALRDRLGGASDFVEALSPPDLHLDEQAIAAAGLDVGAVARTAAALARRMEGIDAAFTRADLLAGRLPGDPRSERVRRAFHPARSGDVVLVAAPFWSWHASVPGNAATHGSPYRYDTHVPLIFHVPGVRPRTVHRPVAPRDVAPTLATLLGLPWPSGATGEVLGEALPAPGEPREF